MRVFLSSPGDLVDERGIALAVVDDLRYEPEVAGITEIEAIAWDDLGSGRPVFATETPQASLNRGQRRPADCDIVVVMFWGRMGTALPHPAYGKPDGSPYLSGTEWEYFDALDGHSRTGRPLVLLYRRLPMPGLDVTSPTLEDELDQQRNVVAFFASQTDDSGALVAGTNVYSSPEQFRQLLRRDLRFTIAQLGDPLDDSVENTLVPAVWPGSPFPGLRSFTPQDAPIFFGRGRNVDAVIARMTASRFVAVVGASGSGKSSLVGAGVIPRLAKLAIPGVDHWLLPEFNDVAETWSGLRITPGAAGGDPFASLAQQLAPLVGGIPDELRSELRRTPGSLAHVVADAVEAAGAGHSEILVFVDQFEELFTLSAPDDIGPFVRLLATAALTQNLRVIVTLRSDFYPRALEEPALADLLELGHVPLPRPAETLSEMIERPAMRAGLRFEEGLVDRILRDAGHQLESLPLLAYTLDELYRACGSTGELNHSAYEQVGGLHGAIGTRADTVFAALDDRARQCFRDVFRQLVDVDTSGRVTRRRALLPVVAVDRPARQLVDAFTAAGLLVTESTTSVGGQPNVFVAHEALFSSWPQLRRWIDEVGDDLAQVRSAVMAAEEWHRESRPESHRWPHERMIPVRRAAERLELEVDPATAAFLEPEERRLLTQLRDAALPVHQRHAAADRLAMIGPDAVAGLAAALEDPDPTARSLASSAIGRLAGPARGHVGHIERILETGSSDAVLAAVSAVVELGDPELIPAITRLLGHDELRVRSFARGALHTLGGTQAATALGDDLVGGIFDDRWESAGALAALGSSAVPSLIRAMTNTPADIRDRTRLAARAAGAMLVEETVTLLFSHDATTRLGAARLLASIGSPALTSLTSASASADTEVAELAVAALAEIADPQGLDAVVTAAGDDRVVLRRAAARALLNLADASVAPTLIALLEDGDLIVRRAAATALGRIGSAIDSALEGLLAAAASPGARLRAVANVALVGPSAARALATRAAVETDDSVRRQLIGALAELTDEAVDHLARLVAAAPTAAADDAAMALASLGERSTGALVELMRSSDVEVRKRAIRGLGPTFEVDLVPMVATALRDADEQLRRSAAIVLGRWGEDALPTLIRALAEPEADVREAASFGLVTAGGVAAPSLISLLTDSSIDHDLVVQTLRSIRTPTALLGLAAAQ